MFRAPPRLLIPLTIFSPRVPSTDLPRQQGETWNQVQGVLITPEYCYVKVPEQSSKVAVAQHRHRGLQPHPLHGLPLQPGLVSNDDNNDNDDDNDDDSNVIT